MSRFVNREAIDDITLANGDTVQVRQRLDAEEDAMLQSHLVKLHADMAKGKIEVTEVVWYLQRLRICEAYLVGWDFKGDDDQLIPFATAKIRDLDDDTVGEIATAINLLQTEYRNRFEKKVLVS